MPTPSWHSLLGEGDHRGWGDVRAPAKRSGSRTGPLGAPGPLSEGKKVMKANGRAIAGDSPLSVRTNRPRRKLTHERGDDDQAGGPPLGRGPGRPREAVRGGGPGLRGRVPDRGRAARDRRIPGR